MTEPAPAHQVPVCPRHPDRPSYVRCQRCGRPTCPECQRPAPVGIQCVDCVREGSRTVRQAGSRYGAPARPAGRPLVTSVIVGLCVLVYVGQLVDPRVTQLLAFAPVVADDQPWRFVTAAFAHSPSSIMHILFNMYALWLTGSYLEPLLGRAKFLALYLVSAIGGSVGYLLLARFPAGWGQPTVGASGAVFGLFAAMLVLNRHLGRQTGGIFVVLAINGVLGFVIPGIAWQAHLGGALTGAAVAGVLVLTAPADRLTREARRKYAWPAIAAVLVVLVAAAVWRIAAVEAGTAPAQLAVHTLSTGWG